MPFAKDQIPVIDRINTTPHPKMALAFFVLCISITAFSQPANRDSLTGPLQSMYNAYMTGVGGAANLYQGAEYEGSYPLVLGSPFWNDRGFERGTVSYDGIAYYNVPLAYDLVRNEVVIKGFQQLSQRVERAKLDSFTLSGHTYVHLRTDTANRNSLPDDLYDRLYNGSIQVYAKRTKQIVRSFHAEAQDTIISRTSYFLHKDNAYYPVSDQASLLAVFHQEKSGLKTFWKEARLSFKKDPELFIIQTVNHWSGLKK